MAVLEAASLKEAIAHCAPLANKGRRWKGEATEMDGILLRLNADSIEFFAATGTMLISHRLPLHHSASFSFTGLFPGKALSWMKESLSDGEVTLALARDEHTHKDVLLFSTAQMTWFSRSMDAPLPSTWTNILHMPHEAEVLIWRRELMNPLKFFAGSVSTLSQALSLETEGTLLRMSIVASDNAVREQRMISLLHSSRELNILVDPKQFKELVYYAGGDQLRLQVGHFERQRGQRRKRIGFLRITSKQTTVMMSLSRRELMPSLPTSPPIHGAVSVEIDTEPVFAAQEA